MRIVAALNAETGGLGGGGEVGAGGTDDELEPGSALWVQGRLQRLEEGLASKLEDAGKSLQRGQRLLAESCGPLAQGRQLAAAPLRVPLHPLPAEALEAAAGNVLRSEVVGLKEELQAARRELSDCEATKVSRRTL